MRIERHKNFLNQDECDALNVWTELGVQNKWLDLGLSRTLHGYTKRVTSRLYPDRFEYPQFVHNISKKIREFCGVDSYGLIEGHGRDGVVVSCTFFGGDVYAHKDPTNQNGLAALRCNVMTQAADAGGILHIDGEPIDIGVGELHCYLASEFEHFVTPVEENTPRIMWMFGAHVPSDLWENNHIKFGVS